MIEINLLPEGVRKAKRFYPELNLEMGKVKILVGAIFVGVLILLLIIFSIGSLVRKRQIVKLLAKEKIIEPQRSDVDAVNKEVSILKVKMGLLDEITKREFLWARKLNELSDLVLPGIWFTRIHTDSEDRLIIEGSVISKREEAMASVGKFMKDIRAHNSFFKDFSNIKLESVQRKNIDERDVVDFKIALYF